MTDPGDADFAGPDFGKKRSGACARSLREKGGDEDLGEEIALVPIQAGLQTDAGRR